MLVREILPEEKDQYNALVAHPLQSWEWGQFRQKCGLKVFRLGEFDQNKLLAGYQLTLHPVPHTQYTVGYLPKGPKPDEPMLRALQDLGRKENCLFIKLEPNVVTESLNCLIKDFSQLVVSPKPLFTKYTFQIDLTLSEEELLSKMNSKTRYNVRLAQKKGVVISEDHSSQALENYLKLTKETTNRQHFYAHDENYHRLMWSVLQPAGISHLLKAVYQDQVLATWILFHFHDTLYYPYGASGSQSKEVMASNLMMWEAMRFGKKLGCQNFDLWGSLGSNPNPQDPWYGFHRFKEGYGPKLVEFIGSYDLVLNQRLYSLYNLADKLRWRFLRLKSRLKDGS